MNVPPVFHHPTLGHLHLGRKPSPWNAKRLWLADYIDRKALPPAPASVNWTASVPTPCGMMGNDSVGDCTIAGRAHMIQVWTGNAQPPGTVLADSEVLAEYSRLSGYTPDNPASDTGLNPIEVLQDWQYNGAEGHKIRAWCNVNPKNLAEIQVATNIFGGLYAAVALPLTAQAQVGGVWDTDPSDKSSDAAPYSWGGHLAPFGGYNAQGPGAITWGQWWQQMTWAFSVRYYDELFAVVTDDFLNTNNLDPQGLGINDLLADQALLGT